MATTIKDVAKLAQVSPSTVSRVLHDNSRISNTTKERVMQAMHSLNYHPNAIARSLAKSNTKTLGLILPNDELELFQNSFFIQAMRGISIYAKLHGYKLMYNFSIDEQEEIEYLENYIHDNWVEGVILFTSRQDDKCINYLHKRAFPFTVIGRPSSPETGFWVDNDNFQAMYSVTEYLIEKNCSSIAFLGGLRELDVTLNRLSGYKQAIKSHGLELQENLICTTTRFSEEEAYEQISELLNNNTVDAIAATDDILAFGAIRAMQDFNQTLLPIIGFNNTVRGQYQTPALSSVEINPTELGYKACKLLIDSLEGLDNPYNHFIVETKFIERDTTQPQLFSKRLVQV
ncbi:MAG: LacI family transcriptional regulator [Spirochaetes bacterium]|nr:LacI family transcriptional regulator [Spirochaetota bacterium]MBU0956233.1 LacI family transcriptional regulator [Spirochaetota bacterium]